MQRKILQRFLPPSYTQTTQRTTLISSLSFSFLLFLVMINVMLKLHALVKTPSRLMSCRCSCGATEPLSRTTMEKKNLKIQLQTRLSSPAPWGRTSIQIEGKKETRLYRMSLISSSVAAPKQKNGRNNKKGKNKNSDKSFYSKKCA